MADIVPVTNDNHDERLRRACSDNTNGGSPATEQGGLSLNDICQPGDPRRTAGARTSSGTDYYFYYGETGGNRPGCCGGDNTGSVPSDHQFDRSDQQPVDYGNAPESQVTLSRGQTFWDLAAEKYNGHYPIEAIYAANGLKPTVSTDLSGHITLEDPTYYAGKTYILPAAKDVPALIDKYRQTVAEEGGYSQGRVGPANETTEVKLIYGDTFWRLAQAKYGQSDHPPIEAIYEANNLMPTVHDDNGKITFDDPTYYAGHTYKLPSMQEVPRLEREFWAKIGHPEMCPPEYQEGGSSGQPSGTQPPCDHLGDKDGDDYRQYGPSGQYGPPVETPQQAWQAGYSAGWQTAESWREGYIQGFRDAEFSQSTPGLDQFTGPAGPNGPGGPIGPVPLNGAWNGQPPTGDQVPPGQADQSWYGYDGETPQGPQGGRPYLPQAGGPYSMQSDYTSGSPTSVTAAYTGNENPPPDQVMQSSNTGPLYGSQDASLQSAINMANVAYTQSPGLRVYGGQFDNGQPNPGLYNPNAITPITSPGDWTPLSQGDGGDGPQVNYGGDDGSPSPYLINPSARQQGG